MVTVPAIQDRLDFVGRYGGDDGPGGLRVVSLAGGVLIEIGVVHHSPGRAVSLGCDHHAAGPSDWVVHRNSLQNTQADISVESILDSLLPVQGNLAG